MTALGERFRAWLRVFVAASAIAACMIAAPVAGASVRPLPVFVPLRWRLGRFYRHAGRAPQHARRVCSPKFK